MKQILIFLPSMIFLIGCGGGSSSSSPVSNSDYAGPMAISEIYTVFPGDSVTKDSASPLIKIIHIDGATESTIELVEGNATIVRKP